MKKVIYDITDICVACGKPSPPGDMLCWECRKNANAAGMKQVQPAEDAALNAVNTEDQSKPRSEKIRNWLEGKIHSAPKP